MHHSKQLLVTASHALPCSRALFGEVLASDHGDLAEGQHPCETRKRDGSTYD